MVPAWPDYERRAAFANAGSFIGCMLTIYFCGRTRAGEPRCATGIAMRAAEAGAMTEADVQWRTYGPTADATRMARRKIASGEAQAE